MHYWPSVKTSWLDIGHISSSFLVFLWSCYNHTKALKGPCSPKWLCVLVLLFWNAFFVKFSGWLPECSLFSHLAEARLYTHWRLQFLSKRNHFSGVQGVQSCLGERGPLIPSTCFLGSFRQGMCLSGEAWLGKTRMVCPQFHGRGMIWYEIFTRKACKSLDFGSWFTSISRVLPTFCVGTKNRKVWG